MASALASAPTASRSARTAVTSLGKGRSAAARVDRSSAKARILHANASVVLARSEHSNISNTSNCLHGDTTVCRRSMLGHSYASYSSQGLVDPNTVTGPDGISQSSSLATSCCCCAVSSSANASPRSCQTTPCRRPHNSRTCQCPLAVNKRYKT